MSSRIVVALAEGYPEEDPPEIPVGVLPWPGEASRLVIVVKATFSYADRTCLRWAAVQEALSRGRSSTLPGAAPGELAQPDDFVPRKAGVDVLVTGSAFSDAPVGSIAGAVQLAGWSRRFVAHAGAAATAIPLSSGHVPGGEPLGPVATAAAGDREPLADGFDFGLFNAAAQSQRVADIAADALLVLDGLVRGSARAELRLPGVVAAVTLSVPSDPDLGVPMVCDTLWIDTDRELVVLTWRGTASGPGRPTGAALTWDAMPDVSLAHQTSRIALSIERSGGVRAAEDRLAALQRGRFGFAVRAHDVDVAWAIGEDERAALERARYATWGSKAPPPRMALAEYARLAAELAERPTDRADALARAGLDEDRFMIEERAWLEKAAREAGDGDMTLAADLGAQLAQAQKEVAIPRELELGAYAELSVLIDVAEDPAAALRDNALSIPQWMRIDEAWTVKAERDPALRAELERAVASARARWEARRASGSGEVGS